jgi:hypothetical protein
MDNVMEQVGTILQQDTLVLWAVPMAAGVVIVILLWWLQQHGDAHRRLAKTFKRLQCEYLRDAVVPDGVGGHIQIDYLVLAPQGVLVLDVRNYRGALFGATGMQVWTQMLRSGSFRFENPIPANQLRAQAVRLLVPEVPVLGRVLFLADGRFPKGKPEGVALLEDLPALLAPSAPAGPAERLRRAWEALLRIAADSAPLARAA